MSKKMLALAAAVMSATFATTTFATTGSPRPTQPNEVNTGLAGRGRLMVKHDTGFAKPYALTGSQNRQPQIIREIRVGSRIVATVPVNENR